jgi:putative SOS response-associated peptidase YedK
MCGRFYLFSTGAAVADLFDLAGPVEVTPQYSIAPSQAVAFVRNIAHGREVDALPWESFARDSSTGGTDFAPTYPSSP